MPARPSRSEPDLKPPYRPKRGVIILVDDEPEQEATYRRLRELGFGRLRVVTA